MKDPPALTLSLDGLCYVCETVGGGRSAVVCRWCLWSEGQQMKLWWWRDGDPCLTWSISFMRCWLRVKWVYCHGAVWAVGWRRGGSVVSGGSGMPGAWVGQAVWWVLSRLLPTARGGIGCWVAAAGSVGWPDFADVCSVFGSDGWRGCVRIFYLYR